MEEFIQNMVAKVGIDEAKARKVMDFIQENAGQIPGLLASSGIADKLPGGIGDALEGFLGGDKT